MQPSSRQRTAIFCNSSNVRCIVKCIKPLAVLIDIFTLKDASLSLFGHDFDAICPFQLKF